MSQFYDQSSLVFLPSGYRDGKLYSQKPLSTSGELSFSRGSDIEATRVNANGYIEKAQVNLLLQSNQFDTTWVNTSSTLTSGQSGYDGTSDAWKLEATATGGQILQYNSTSGVSSLSIYAKAGNVSWIHMRYDNTTAADLNSWFNLSDGSVGSNNGIASYSENVGGGWWRLVVQMNTIDLNNLRIYPSNSDGNNADAGEYIYIQDAQLNYGLVAQTYQETTTAAVVSGITDNMPRLNYDPANPTCPSLLLEPSRQNILANDTYIAGTFAFDNCTASYNNSISPEGVQNAVLLTQSGSASSNSIYNFSLPTTAGNYAYSLFFKAGTSSKCRIYTHDSFTNLIEDFNPQTITAGKTGGDLDLNFEDYGNDWWRVSFSRSVASGASYHRFSFYPDRNNTNGNISLYGFQIESGSYSSSLIPTYGSSATRTQDIALNTSASSIIGQTEGTLYWEGSMIEGVNNDVFYIGGSTDGVAITKVFTTSDRFRFYIRQNGVQTLLTSGAVSNVGENVKVAIAYKSGDIVAYVNGSQQASSSIALSFSATISSILLANSAFWLNYATKECKQALLFKTRLSNADLATLTTL